MMEKQLIPAGFKFTEIGVIPNDWNIENGEAITSLIGKGASPRWQGFSYTDAGMLFVTSENVRDGFLDLTKPKFLPLAFHEKLQRSKLQKDDILINLVGASIGRSCLIKHDLGEANINQAVAIFRVKEQYNSKFVACYFQSPICIDRIFGMQVDAARPNVSLGDLRKFLLPLPPEEEQTAIANALSDVDALIAALEKLINKKSAIKTAAMQQLLTGKKRLPPFDQLNTGYKQTELGEIPGDWDVCELIEAVDFLDGLRRPVKSSDRAKVQGIYPYYGASGIVDYVSDYIFDDDLILLGEDGENILSRSLPLAFRVSGKIWVNNHAHVLKPKDDFVIGFLTDFLESLDYSLLNSGTAQPKLNKQACSKIKIAKPSQEEQIAIANVLSDMDKELEALQQRLHKTQQIKQGMMQELLTGNTRLVG